MEWDLSELIENSILRKVQESVVEMTGMSVLVADEEGKVLCEGMFMPSVCTKYHLKGAVSREKCSACYVQAGKKAMEMGSAYVGQCHLGLTFFVAPIVVQGEFWGVISISPGYRDGIPGEEVLRSRAREYGFSEQLYLQTCNLQQDYVEYDEAQILEYVYTMGRILSDIAEGKRGELEANKDIEESTKMKSGFLANMSHEIRTPMNAVIGMAEMALREDLSPSSRDHISQIRQSGKALLGIINDILDYSKMESGKMEIICDAYEPLSFFQDITGHVMTRLKGKPIELILEMNPHIPCNLYGDNLRIKQVLLNITSNAVKFTRRGRIRIRFGCEKIDASNVNMIFSVLDTGCGIKEEDQEVIFESFRQADSKRNRSNEGSGLGLSISKMLVELMGGSISLVSEVDRGTEFTICIPQRVVDWTPSLSVKDVDHVVAVGYFRNRYLAREFFKDAQNLGAYTIAVSSLDKYEDIAEYYEKQIAGKRIYMFTEKESFSEYMYEVAKQQPEITFVVLTEYDSEDISDLPNIRMVRKPFSTMTVALMLNDEYIASVPKEKEEDLSFTAPEAKILIVDDNSINLMVAEGLLEPLNMQIDTALSGKEALEKMAENNYHIVFMDHMMPEMDGIETTKAFRELHPEKRDMPILALTANSAMGMKEIFMDAGMNDYVPKPIEVRAIVSKVKMWLPSELIQKSSQKGR